MTARGPRNCRRETRLTTQSRGTIFSKDTTAVDPRAVRQHRVLGGLANHERTRPTMDILPCPGDPPPGQSAPAGDSGIPTPFPRRIYAGPIPSRPVDYYALTQPRRTRQFIYFLMSSDDVHVYIGRSWNPGTRFDRHRRRAWWEHVDKAELYQLDAATPYQADALIHAYEQMAIRELSPAFNVAGVVR